MTRTTNARVAGVTFLLYIAVGIGAMILGGRAAAGEGVAAKLESYARHAPLVQGAVVLNLACVFAALVLAVTLYALTRDQDRDLALLGLVCRVGEGVVGGVSLQRILGVLWLATATGADAPDPQAAQAMAGFLLEQGWSPVIAAMFFAVGSTFFSWLFLRGRMIPTVLAWLGVAASIALVVGLPLQLGGVLDGTPARLLWIPMAVFEVVLAVWLIVKGAALPARTAAPARLSDAKRSPSR
jgi:hypothetical protein